MQKKEIKDALLMAGFVALIALPVPILEALFPDLNRYERRQLLSLCFLIIAGIAISCRWLHQKWKNKA